VTFSGRFVASEICRQMERKKLDIEHTSLLILVVFYAITPFDFLTLGLKQKRVDNDIKLFLRNF